MTPNILMLFWYCGEQEKKNYTPNSTLEELSCQFCSELIVSFCKLGSTVTISAVSKMLVVSQQCCTVALYRPRWNACRYVIPDVFISFKAQKPATLANSI